MVFLGGIHQIWEGVAFGHALVDPHFCNFSLDKTVRFRQLVRFRIAHVQWEGNLLANTTTKDLGKVEVRLVQHSQCCNDGSRGLG